MTEEQKDIKADLRPLKILSLCSSVGKCLKGLLFVGGYAELRYSLIPVIGMLAIKNREYVSAYSRLIFLSCEVRCYASMLALRALRSMNSRRGATSSPMSIEKMRSASAASAIDTCFNIRFCGSIVVSQSCSGFISPKPL